MFDLFSSIFACNSSSIESCGGTSRFSLSSCVLRVSPRRFFNSLSCSALALPVNPEKVSRRKWHLSFFKKSCNARWLSSVRCEISDQRLTARLTRSSSCRSRASSFCLILRVEFAVSISDCNSRDETSRTWTREAASWIASEDLNETKVLKKKNYGKIILQF